MKAKFSGRFFLRLTLEPRAEQQGNRERQLWLVFVDRQKGDLAASGRVSLINAEPNRQ